MIGNRKVNEKEYAEAIRLYGEAIVLNPKNAVYYANRYEFTSCLLSDIAKDHLVTLLTPISF
jgi:hypothetical protein